MIVAAVDDYTVGYTIRERLRRCRRSGARRDRGGVPRPVRPYLLDSGEFPLLSRFVAEGGDLPETDRFEDGLDWLLDGFAAKLG